MIRLRLTTFILIALSLPLMLSFLFLGVTLQGDLQRTISEGFDRKLQGISSAVGAFIDGEEHAELLDPSRKLSQKSPLYLRYVLPMRRIKKAENLTYLYTQVLQPDGKTVKYGIDANEDDQHTEIGALDTLPKEDIRGAMLTERIGELYVSGVQTWGKWGQLKMGLAPIYDRRGTIRAAAGADIDLAIIDEQRRSILFQILLLGLLSLALGGGLSVLIARKLEKPIEELRDEALALAAGRPIATNIPEGARELTVLARALREIQAALQGEAFEAPPLDLEGSLIDKMFALRRIEPFQRIEQNDLAQLAAQARFRMYAPGESLDKAIKPPDRVYALLNGQVLLGNQPVTGLIGSAALLEERPLDEEMTAGSEGAECLWLSKGHFFSLARAYPELFKAVKSAEETR